MAESNPQLILESGEAVEKPPALIMRGAADNLTPDMAASFAAAYRNAGGPISFHSFAGQSHPFRQRTG